MLITEFLEARIAEDEAVAREEDEDYADTTLLPTYDSDHQANWNTARVLAECAAKRAIIAEHSPVDICDAHDAEFRTITCGTVRALIAVYGDHPDYRQEWAT